MSRGRILVLLLILVVLGLVAIFRNGPAPESGAGKPGAFPGSPPQEIEDEAPRAERSGSPRPSAGVPDGSPDGPGAPTREPVRGERAESETRLLRVSGTVRDRSGRPLPAIQITIFRPGFRGIGGTVVAHQRTDREGCFSLEAPRGQDLVVEATSEEYRMKRVRLRPGGGAHDLVLESLEPTELLGRLFDPEGRPLSTRDLYRLLPELDPLGDEFLVAEPGTSSLPRAPAFDQLSRLVLFSSRGPGRSGGQLSVEVDPATARFRAELDGRFEGELALIFRGQEIDRWPFRSGDPELRLTVDVEALFAALGRIEVEALDAETGAPLAAPEVELIRENRLPGRPLDVERLGGESGDSLQLEGVPPGRYLVVARAHGYAPRSRPVEVAAGGSVLVRLRLSRPASVRVFLRFPEGIELLAEQLEFGYVDRNNAEHPIEVVGLDLGSRLAARVTSVPVGPGALLLDDSVLRVDLKPGENPDLDWELRPVRDYRIQIQLFPSPYDELDRFVDGWLEQFDLDGLRIGGRQLQRLEVDGDGWVTLEGSTATGRYLWRIDFGELRRVETRMTIGAGPSSSFRLPLP